MKHETKLPGIKAVHRIVTDTCRETKGTAVAYLEAEAALRDMFNKAIKGNGDTKGVNYHVVLVVELPE